MNILKKNVNPNTTVNGREFDSGDLIGLVEPVRVSFLLVSVVVRGGILLGISGHRKETSPHSVGLPKQPPPFQTALRDIFSALNS